MNWDQNKELVEQILRTGMYAKLYDEETTYGYLTWRHKGCCSTP